MSTRKPRQPHIPQSAKGAAEPVETKPDATAASGARETTKPVAQGPSVKSASRQSAASESSAASTKNSGAARSGRGAARSTDRPGRTSQSVAGQGQPVPARAFSGRVIALIVTVIVVAVLLAPTVNTYLQQRADIAALKADIQAKKQEQASLNTQISRWSDPAYVKQQARDRVNMVMPGETGYWVYGGTPTPAAPSQPGTSANPDGLPWVDGLWQSIQRSGTQ
ncbi:FtsB family cell division protein [Psychromicrobium xiongbiense]|uniref:FtsB family cell division protein n=1 Tax=Psychromicrobium xiongbiense TaxID=3051184 RepID=UPI002554B25B|nr:septum formation initiator family protein [Psychromicrobium sp. YIM S02556]